MNIIKIINLLCIPLDVVLILAGTRLHNSTCVLFASIGLIFCAIALTTEI